MKTDLTNLAQLRQTALAAQGLTAEVAGAAAEAAADLEQYIKDVETLLDQKQDKPSGEETGISVIPYGVQIQSIDALESYVPRIKNNLTVDPETNTTVSMNIYAYSPGFYLVTSSGAKTFLSGVMAFDVYEDYVRVLMPDQRVWSADYTTGDTSSAFSSIKTSQKPYPGEFPRVDGATIVVDEDWRELKVPIDNKTIVVKDGKVALAGLPAGPAGADGKSAYQYAVDGGYTGTEEDFKALMGTGPWLPSGKITMSASVPAALPDGAIHFTYS